MLLLVPSAQRIDSCQGRGTERMDHRSNCESHHTSTSHTYHHQNRANPPRNVLVVLPRETDLCSHVLVSDSDISPTSDTAISARAPHPTYPLGPLASRVHPPSTSLSFRRRPRFLRHAHARTPSASRPLFFRRLSVQSTTGFKSAIRQSSMAQSPLLTSASSGIVVDSDPCSMVKMEDDQACYESVKISKESMSLLGGLQIQTPAITLKSEFITTGASSILTTPPLAQPQERAAASTAHSNPDGNDALRDLILGMAYDLDWITPTEEDSLRRQPGPAQSSTEPAEVKMDHRHSSLVSATPEPAWCPSTGSSRTTTTVGTPSVPATPLLGLEQRTFAISNVVGIGEERKRKRRMEGLEEVTEDPTMDKEENDDDDVEEDGDGSASIKMEEEPLTAHSISLATMSTCAGKTPQDVQEEYYYQRRQKVRAAQRKRLQLLKSTHPTAALSTTTTTTQHYHNQHHHNQAMTFSYIGSNTMLWNHGHPMTAMAMMTAPSWIGASASGQGFPASYYIPPTAFRTAATVAAEEEAERRRMKEHPAAEVVAGEEEDWMSTAYLVFPSPTLSS